MGRSTEAVGELTRAIELDPRNVAFYEARSHLLEQQGMFQQALADVRQVLNLQRSQKGG
jgi:Flp pilus assembly protein TadD